METPPSFIPFFATNIGGVAGYLPDRDAFTSFTDTKKGLITTVDIYEDRKGRFWIGTYQAGLHLLNRETGEVKVYNESDGLVSNLVIEILEDENGLLWLLTDSGLSRFDPDLEQFDNFSVSDGLATDNFRRGSASLVSSTGQIYLAGEVGLTVFHPEDVVKDSTPPQVLITDFELFNEAVSQTDQDSPLETSISQSREITLRHNQNAPAFTYTALHYGLPEENEYAVMLEGVDPDWVYVGTERRRSYAGLRPGRYTFRVKAANADGIWTEEPTELRITILQPWWWSGWAKAFYILGILGFLYLLRQHELSKQQRQLEEEQEKLEQERMVNEQLRRVDQLKDQFLANTSHELRTPLNGIIGLTESLKDGVAGPVTGKAKDNLNMIISSGKRLGNLVNDILDFSKLKNHDLTLQTMAMDLHSAVDVVLSLSQPLTKGKDIMMPKMSGYEVCEKLRSYYLPSELPVVMLTANNRVNDLVQGFNTGANDYLTKPFSKDELLSRIKTHLNLHRIHQATDKFVPGAFIKSIGRSGITEVKLGDQVAQEVTVLFSDIRGYMKLSETMSPEDNFRFVSAYSRRMGPVIQSNQGFVHQYMGDGLMAIFQQSPADALQAAVTMHEKIRDYNYSSLPSSQ